MFEIENALRQLLLTTATDWSRPPPMDSRAREASAAGTRSVAAAAAGAALTESNRHRVPDSLPGGFVGRGGAR
jgi:hypothetical protein